jgi:D-lactate dehydrogenase (cytochrome)
VPFSRLADIIEVSKKEMDDLGLFASILGHIGDGNFHESIIYNRRDPAETEKVETCVKNMVKRALEMEGTCTGEHSIGWGKKEALVWEVGHDTLGVMVSREFTLGLQSANTTTESDQGRVGPQMDHVGHAPIHCQ